MKKLFIYTAFISIVFLLFGCDKPAPTELIEDSSQEVEEYEVLTNNLNDEYYSNGFDTTGITQDITGLANIITVSGIKVTDINGQTDNFSLAKSIFFDKSKPVYSSDGRLLAYHTFLPGIIKFNNILARTVPFRIRFRDRGTLRDTLLGEHYLLYSGRHGGFDRFNFIYNSFVNFDLQVFNGERINFNIPTPKELLGDVQILGSRQHKNLRARIRWNAAVGPKLEIIIGVRARHNHNLIIPLFKVKTRDDGELIVPERIISKIPVQDYDRLVFTLIRRFEHLEQYSGNNNLYISSQSIHSIVVNFN